MAIDGLPSDCHTASVNAKLIALRKNMIWNVEISLDSSRPASAMIVRAVSHPPIHSAAP